VNVSLEVESEEAEAEVSAKIPQVRNAVIDLFNSKHPSDLANAEGRDALKEEIRSAINGFLTRGRVKGVFFTNFVLGS
jgi:flagellar FliL protein